MQKWQLNFVLADKMPNLRHPIQKITVRS
jgi:hypothetical protein